MSAAREPDGGDVSTRRLPPVHLLSVSSMALVIVGGILMASRLPERPPLTAPVALLAVSVVLLLASLALVGSIDGFDRRTFHRVAGWALLAYLVIAGMLEYVFLLDHTRGAVLVVLSLMLLVFAVDIPVVLGFSVARY